MNNYKIKWYMWAVIVVLVAVTIMLSGCNTVAGVGKDIQGSAEWTKEKINQSKQEPSK